MHELFDADVVGTDRHLALLDALRARGDVVELAGGQRRTFIALSRAAVAAGAAHPFLSSRFGSGTADAPEARDPTAADDAHGGVPFDAVNMSDGAAHRRLRACFAALDACARRDAAPDAYAPPPLRPGAAQHRPGTAPPKPHAAFGLETRDVVAWAGDRQRAWVAPALGFAPDDAALVEGARLARQAAFAWHDEADPPRALTDVDARLVALARAAALTRTPRAALPMSAQVGADATPAVVDAARALDADTAAWLVRFAFITAFATTELATAHLLALLADDALIDRVRTDRASRAGLVAESLRHQAPVARFGRVAVDDVELGTALVPRGARVILSYAAACHDPALYANPRMVDVDRTARGEPASLAFGAGPHACAGAQLAHAILRNTLDEALEALADRRVVVEERVVLRSPVNRGLRRCVLAFPRARP